VSGQNKLILIVGVFNMFNTVETLQSYFTCELLPGSRQQTSGTSL